MKESSVAKSILVMGVAGSGKSTLGRALARHLGWTFVEADHFHPAASIAKMSRGEPLSDADREPWLRALAAELHRFNVSGEGVILACSALKERYRAILREGTPRLRVIYLKGQPQSLLGRLKAREGHFMPPDLLQSQFDALEEPPDALVIPAETPLPLAAEWSLRFIASRES